MKVKNIPFVEAFLTYKHGSTSRFEKGHFVCPVVCGVLVVCGFIIDMHITRVLCENTGSMGIDFATAKIVRV